MSAPLLKTKLFVPPVRPKVVSRPSLVGRLSEGMDEGRRLTLVSAPAGYGKTTLLSEWIAEGDLAGRVAWLSLDESDNDPARFWPYVAAALQTVREEIELIAPTAFQPPHPRPVDAVLIRLLNQILDAPDRITLVIDDYHAIENPAIHQGLSFLLDNMPPQMHLVIATRVDPPLPIARLRARGQLAEVYEADLRFTPDEVAQFLTQVMELDLSAEDVSALRKRTEGWIAGLQMAAVSMRDREDPAEFVRTFSGSHRYILDYLGGEVLRQQRPRVRQFLLQTAILDRLTAPLCNAVVEDAVFEEDDTDPQAMLEYLERSNLFVVPLDAERRWYRYHHLFAELLCHRLRRESPGLERELHRRASLWYEAGEFWSEAVGHALSSGDVGRAADLVEQAGWASFTRGEMTTIINWIKALPNDLVRSRPPLSFLHAWALAKSGQLDGVELCLAVVDPQHYQGEATAVRAYVAGVRGDLPRAVELAQRALERLPEENLLLRAIVAQNLGVAYHWSGNSAAAVRSLTKAVRLSRAADQPFQTLTAMAILGRALEVQGALRRAMEVYQEALELASERSQRPVPFACMAYVGMAGPLYEWNDLDEARRCALEGIRLSELGGFAAYELFGHVLLARVCEAQGDRDGGEEMLQNAEHLERGREYALVMAMAAEFRTQLWLAQGSLAAASRWVEERDVSPGDALDSAREIEQMAVARVLIAQGEPGKALSRLAWLLEAAEGAGRTGSVIKMLALRALGFDAQDNLAGALEALERALSLGEAEGYVRTFLDEGAPMARLLRRALTQGIAPNYVARLLAAFGDEALATSPKMDALIEPLTDRELEVLRLIVAGLSNPEIAEELFIAVSTVKSHVNHIYGKLGVSNRVEAVTRARDLSLL